MIVDCYMNNIALIPQENIEYNQNGFRNGILLHLLWKIRIVMGRQPTFMNVMWAAYLHSIFPS